MTSILARLLFVATLSAVFGTTVLLAGGETEMERHEMSFIDTSFDLLPPAGWAIERRAGGAVLTGPTAEGIYARIIVRYVSADHTLYGTPEAYMQRHTMPSSIPLKGWKNGEIERVEAAGRKALLLERDTTEYTAPHSIAPKEVAMREEHLAVTAAKGFFLLVYTAPRSIDEAQRPVFRRLVENGFRPKL